MDPVVEMVRALYDYCQTKQTEPDADEHRKNTEERVSIHEGGHAVVAAWHELPVEQVSLFRGKKVQWEGCTKGPDVCLKDESPDVLGHLVECLCAGVSAELVFLGDYACYTFGDDFAFIRQALAVLVLRTSPGVAFDIRASPDLMCSSITSFARKAVDYLSIPANKEAVRKLAEELRKRPDKALSGTEALAIIQTTR